MEITWTSSTKLDVLAIAMNQSERQMMNMLQTVTVNCTILVRLDKRGRNAKKIRKMRG
jgi:hypothetical protein